MRHSPIRIIVHYPVKDEAQRELENQVARVHADFVLSKVKSLSCPSAQKLALINSIIEMNNSRPDPKSDQVEPGKAHAIQI